ncbi:MAG: hypothetical protein GY809_01605, partial [Planctomycetes bacterium]|nr:hypothetical protein [Planctomycetota bacterium]
MKRVTKVVLLITILVLASVNMAIAFDPLSDPSLVAWWAFDEGTGTLAADGSGHGNNGTLNGSAAWVPGVYGQALVLNGSDTYVSTEQSLLSDLPEFTLAGWVNVVNTESYAGLFGQNDLVEFGFTSENGGGLGVWMSGNGWTYVGADYSFAYPSWHRVALTGNADRVVMYIDGQEQASDDGGMTAGTSTYGFNIGAYVFNDNAAAVEGELDDVWVYSRALSQEEIQTLMTGLGGPGRASSADPENEANDVPRDSILSWTPGDFAQTHHVYFSSSLADVNAATPDNPLDILTVQNQEANTFDPGRLDFGQTYYWRVDEVNGTPDKTVFRGDIWQFTAEPHSLQIPGSAIAVTASSFANEFSMPVKIVDGSGLGPDNTHSVNAETMWFSGPAELDPWVQFEFDGVKKLDTMRVWNSNSAAEMAIGWGVKDVNIAYSVDGETWTVLDAAKQFNRASGLPAYNQPDSIGFDGVAARHVRLNILNNWGGLLMSYSLSEVQFAMIPAQARSPEPADSSEDVLPDTVATWRAGRDAAEHKVTMGTDPNAVAEGLAPSVTSISPSLDLAPLNLQLDET